MTIVLPLSAFWITRLFSFFNLHSDSNSFLIKLKGGELSLLKTEQDLNSVFCKRAFTLAKSAEDWILCNGIVIQMELKVLNTFS